MWTAGTGRGVGTTEVLRWDGRRWTRVAYAAGQNVLSIGGTSRTDVWVFSDPLYPAMHWDGAQWTRTTAVGSFAPRALWGSRPDDLWAIGFDGAFGIWRWDGNAWNNRTPLPFALRPYPRTVRTPGVDWSARTSGYVTWSSTRLGPRPIQSVNTITWGSVRSGMASRGVWRTQTTAQAASASTRANTIPGRFAQNSMTRGTISAPRARRDRPPRPSRPGAIEVTRVEALAPGTSGKRPLVVARH